MDSVDMNRLLLYNHSACAESGYYPWPEGKQRHTLFDGGCFEYLGHSGLVQEKD